MFIQLHTRKLRADSLSKPANLAASLFRKSQTKVCTLHTCGVRFSTIATGVQSTSFSLSLKIDFAF